MANVNRAVAPGWSIWTDQNDSLSQRDTGWLQFYSENNQEVLDSVIQAYKIAETIYLPCMIVLDAFVLSHTAEIVDIPDQKDVDEFLPPCNIKHRINIEKPSAYGGLATPDICQEFRYNMQMAMEQAIETTKRVDEEFKDKFGRGYGIVEGYRTEDADLILIASATTVGTARVVIDKLRDEGKKPGLLKIRLFRPFPFKEIREHLSRSEKVAVLDRNISFGHHGIFYQEVKSAMYNAKNRPKIFGYICGLGGRDITPSMIEEIILKTYSQDEPREEMEWIGWMLKRT
jgi:pyruvate/2-oxoacid:ferredoxin oxidoreductase alpha subunit